VLCDLFADIIHLKNPGTPPVDHTKLQLYGVMTSFTCPLVHRKSGILAKDNSVTARAAAVTYSPSIDRRPAYLYHLGFRLFDPQSVRVIGDHSEILRQKPKNVRS
jgi:hypothetical protein